MTIYQEYQAMTIFCESCNAAGPMVDCPICDEESCPWCHTQWHSAIIAFRTALKG